MSIRRFATAVLVPSLVFACSSSDGGSTSGGNTGPNPFLQDQSNSGKADTAYQNPDGIEVEVDVEADVTAPSYRLLESPLYVAQFATTYLRQRKEFYVESLAEDSTSRDRVEWLVNGSWISAADAAKADPTTLKHFRIRAMNAVLLHSAQNGVKEGSAFTATVPINPFDLMSSAGDTCADPDSHIGLDSTVYWYLWNPDKSTCKLTTQQMQITVSKMFAENQKTYPEYDQLVADGKVTAVVLFGQIGDGPIDDTETGVRNMKTMATWLKQGGYTEVTPAPVGQRFTKHIADVDFELDLYSPNDFSGLGDYAHFGNLQKAISEHEIVVYDGHSMLGASDFWAKPKYPSFYQIYIYGGCLGYEYYVRPILDGKGGWPKLDLVSSVVEVSADANEIAGPVFAKIAWALEHNYEASWRQILLAVRNRVGDSTFGASGVRDNCFSPSGSLCTGTGGTGGTGGTSGTGGSGAGGTGGSGAGGTGGSGAGGTGGSGAGGTGGSGTGGSGAGGAGGTSGSGGGTSADSCVGYCGSSSPVPGSSPSCYCDTACTNYGDCCADYSTACP